MRHNVALEQDVALEQHAERNACRTYCVRGAAWLSDRGVADTRTSQVPLVNAWMPAEACWDLPLYYFCFA